MLTVVGILAVGVVPAMGQGDWVLSDAPQYVYDGVFTDSVSGGHGIVVDKYNRIWVGNYNYSPMGLRVYDADGTEATFSPIDSVTVPWGTGDTVIYTNASGSCRGISLDNDGNLLYTHGGKLLRINIEDGTGMDFHFGDYSTYSKAAQDADGYIYLAQVVPGDDGPVVVLNDDFTIAQEISIETPPWSRAMEVTSDGSGIWLPNLLSSQKVYNYTTSDFVNYALTDSIHTNAAGDTIIDAAVCGINWGPDGGLWLSGWGNSGDNHIWRFDLAARTYGVMASVDTSLGGFGDNDARGVAFSATGDTMYVISWESPHVFRFVAGIPGSVRADRGIPEGYSLAQNYPNPFNPTTEIRYEIGKMEPTSLVIYTIVGTQIRTLVNTVQPTGEYRVVWDGRDSKGLLLPSGVYVYQLRTGTVNMSKRMILLK